MKDVARELHRVTPTGKPIFNSLTLGEYEGLFRTAARSLQLHKLEICPHALRHGGASHDAFCKIRTLPEIRKRGMWKAFESVVRYEKHGKIMRQLSLLTKSQQEACKVAEIEAPICLLRALRHLPSA